MTDSEILDEPPDENEAFENLDEALDDEDGVRPGAGPEGERDLDTDIVVDWAELEEAGANLDDPERISLLDGGMDDPDGSGPALGLDDDEAGWDVDPVTHGGGRFAGIEDEGADGDDDALPDRVLVDVPPLDDEDEVLYPGLDLDEIPDDAPGLDGGR
jgi:hypothetical protein